MSAPGRDRFGSMGDDFLATLLVQYLDDGQVPVCGLLVDGLVHRHAGAATSYGFFSQCLADGIAPDQAAERFGGPTTAFAALAESGRLLPPITHPEPARLRISGTGLTHRGSIDARDQMHGGNAAAGGRPLTDSMRLFRSGALGGRPANGQPGTVPEWFFKGDGHDLVAPSAAISSPHFAIADGEEPEIAIIYLIDVHGVPRRLGSTVGNEFSDHGLERENYLYLAHSKLRGCSIGPAMRLGLPPLDIQGQARIRRNGAEIWSRPFQSGTDHMNHSLANLEHHHFKYARHRISGDVHVHFLGTAVLSFADHLIVADGDEIEIGADGYGPPLLNSVARAAASVGLMRAEPA